MNKEIIALEGNDCEKTLQFKLLLAHQLYFEKLVSNELKELWNSIIFPLKKSHTAIKTYTSCLSLRPALMDRSFDWKLGFI